VWTSSRGLYGSGSYPHQQSSRPDGAGRRGTGRHYREITDRPRPGEPGSRPYGVTRGGELPRRTLRRS